MQPARYDWVTTPGDFEVLQLRLEQFDAVVDDYVPFLGAGLVPNGRVLDPEGDRTTVLFDLEPTWVGDPNDGVLQVVKPAGVGRSALWWDLRLFDALQHARTWVHGWTGPADLITDDSPVYRLPAAAGTRAGTVLVTVLDPLGDAELRLVIGDGLSALYAAQSAQTASDAANAAAATSAALPELLARLAAAEAAITALQT